MTSKIRSMLWRVGLPEGFLLPFFRFCLLSVTATELKSSSDASDTADASRRALLLPGCINANAVLLESPAAEEASLRAEGALDEVFLLPGVLTVMGSLYVPCPEPSLPTQRTRTCQA